MKLTSVLVLPAIAMLLSCGNTSEAVSDESLPNVENNSVEATPDNIAIGKVVLDKSGCPVKLILEKDDDNSYYPVNLDEMFKVDGAYLQFQYYPSRAPLPPGCESCQAISVENVVRLKR